jgi:uncharacterized protein (TIGR03435 family)
MASRDDLATRVAAVLDRGQSRGRAGASALMTTCAVAVLAVAALSPIRIVAAAQASRTAGDAPAFEVASVRPNEQGFGIMGGDCRGTGSGGTNDSGGGIAAMAKAAGVAPTPPGRCRFTRVTLKQLIAFAYDVSPADMDRLVTGGPRWIDIDRFDVEAKTETLVPVAQMRLMLQRMLVERFKLVVHRESKQMEGLALVVAASGAKLWEATGNEPLTGMRSIGGGPLTASKTTMAMLASVLGQRLRRPVEDRTGLTGIYNFTLSWTPDDNGTTRFGVDVRNLPPDVREKLQSNVDPSGTSLYTALQEQLGLRLVAQTVKGEILVVDAAELPSPN